MEPGEHRENGVAEPPAPDTERDVAAEVVPPPDFVEEPETEVAAAVASDEDGDPEPAEDDEGFSPVPVPPPVLLPLDALADDATFRFRPEGDVSMLATDIARLGQLYPIDVRPLPDGTYQVVSGFRRVEALRFLQRERVLAQVHEGLEDEDALLRALATAVHAEPVPPEALRTLQERLEAIGWLTAPVKDLLEKALTPDPLSPESNEVEVDADELAVDVTLRLGGLNQDLALVAEVFGSLERERREELLQQLRYAAELVAYLEGKS